MAIAACINTPQAAARGDKLALLCDVVCLGMFRVLASFHCFGKLVGFGNRYKARSALSNAFPAMYHDWIVCLTYKIQEWRKKMGNIVSAARDGNSSSTTLLPHATPQED